MTVSTPSRDVMECTFIQEEKSEHFHFWILPRFKWIDELFGNSLLSIRLIMKYAEENMKTEENIEEIKVCVEKLKVLLNE